LQEVKHFRASSGTSTDDHIEGCQRSQTVRPLWIRGFARKRALE
jgi:hypothetical protein